MGRVNSNASNKRSVTKSDSTTSTGQRSIASHVSVRAIGTIPLGGLGLHQPSESPSQSVSSPEASISETPSRAPVPPLPISVCLEKGDVFLVLDLPQGFTIGLDTLAITATSKKILGFRDIPPGPHFLWVSEPAAVSRCGYWFVTGKPSRTHVKQWDRYNEVLGDAASRFEAHDQQKNVGTVYPLLIPHNYRRNPPDASASPRPPPGNPLSPGPLSSPTPDASDDDAVVAWQRLTSAISPALLDRITGKKDVGEWLVDTSDTPKGEISFPQSGRLLQAVAGSELDFLLPQDAIDLDLLSISSTAGSPPDVSRRLLELLADSPGSHSRRATDSDVVGELQFAFLTGMHIGNYSCIEQWWHLVLKVILRCYSLALSRPRLCCDLLQTLYAQLTYSDQYLTGGGGGGDEDYQRPANGRGRNADNGAPTSGILDTIPRNKSRLRTALLVYRQRLYDSILKLGTQATEDQTAVQEAFSDLEDWFWSYGWDLRNPHPRAGGESKAVSDNGNGRFGYEGVDAGGSDEDDYEPVIVELDEEGREVGLVNWN